MASDANKAVMEQLINTFNAMMRQLAGAAGFEHVRYVDLRDTLTNATGYKRDWANESPSNRARVPRGCANDRGLR